MNVKRKLSLRGAKRRACTPKCPPAARGVTACGRGNLMRLFHGVYPELINEILRFAQNDKSEGFAMTLYWQNLIQQ